VKIDSFQLPIYSAQGGGKDSRVIFGSARLILAMGANRIYNICKRKPVSAWLRPVLFSSLLGGTGENPPFWTIDLDRGGWRRNCLAD
jgi:hypothetical protein